MRDDSSSRCACVRRRRCAVPAFAAPVTVKGEIVDQACYTKDKANKGDRTRSAPRSA